MPFQVYKCVDIPETDFQELFCNECTRNGDCVESLNFCVGCGSLFCFQCLKNHEKAESRGQTENNNNQRCTCKPGHSKHQKTKTDLQILYHKLQSLVDKDNVRSGLRLDKMKALVQSKVNEFRTEVMNILDNLEQTALDKVQVIHHNLENQGRQRVQSSQLLMTKIEKALMELGKANTEVMENFVKQLKGDVATILQDNQNDNGAQEIKTEKTDRDNVVRLYTDDLDNALCSINKLGMSCMTGAEDECKEFISYKNYTVQASSDTTVCDINGSCVMADGTVLLTDWNNSNLKWLDTNYKLKGVCPLQGIPWAVCQGRSNEAIVSLYFLEKIQFVALRSEKMVPNTSFKAKGKCKGVAYHNDTIYVSSGGEGIMEGKGQVQAYDRKGNLLECFKTDPCGNPLFSCPQHIAINNNGPMLYVADKNFGLVELDISNERATESCPLLDSDIATKEIKGVCLSGDSKVLICDFIQNNILVNNVRPSGQTNLKVVLQEKNGIRNPQSMCYIGGSCYLIVTGSNTNNVQVYEMASLNNLVQ